MYENYSVHVTWIISNILLSEDLSYPTKSGTQRLYVYSWQYIVDVTTVFRTIVVGGSNVIILGNCWCKAADVKNFTNAGCIYTVSKFVQIKLIPSTL